MLITVLARHSDTVDHVLGSGIGLEKLKDFIYNTLSTDILTKSVAYDLSENYSNDFSKVLEIDVDPKETIFSPNLCSQYDLDHILDPYELLVSMIKDVGHYGFLSIDELVMNFLLNPECSYYYFDRDVGDERCVELFE